MTETGVEPGMKIVVVGGGGREHAVVWKLAQSPLVTEIIAAPGNPGIAVHAECVPITVMDFDGIVSLVRERQPDLVVIGPEDPLGSGLADLITALGIPVAGPSQAAARIESSKSWAKQLMHEDGIPTSRSVTVTSIDDARTAIADLAGDGPVVIKADGLAAGKGVVIAQSADEGIRVAEEFLSGSAFGQSGTTIVIEEFLTGTEVSLLCLTDGTTLYPLLPACDYKRAGDGDLGPNTGGMGVYAPPSFVSEEMLATIRSTILEPTLAGMAKRGSTMRGVLYAGLIVTDSGIKVIEFNARFGDPETQVVLPCLQGDLAELLFAVATGSLGSVAPPAFSGAAVGVAIASGGYPGSYDKGFPITGLPEDLVTWDAESMVFHAGTATGEGGVVTAGGRVVTVVGTGPDLVAARIIAYDRVSRISFEGRQFRTDIALREM
jgi:phosphoribosylamine--glycine ligase